MDVSHAPRPADRSFGIEKLRRHLEISVLDQAGNGHRVPDFAQARGLPSADQFGAGLRELGRIERTLFTLEWLRDPALRRRVNAGLNKGEARNSLSRAVFLNRLGEIRDRSFENQRYRASGLNLIVTAITLWNTVYIERALAALRVERSIEGDLVAHLSPLSWEHIHLTGDYVWHANKRVAKGRFRPLRRSSSPSFEA